MTDPSLYEFSSDFFDALDRASQQDESQSDYVDPSQDQSNTQYDDLVSKYEEQSTLIEDLQKQIESIQGNQPSYVESTFQEDDPNYTMDFIYKNVIQPGDEQQMQEDRKYILQNLYGQDGADFASLDYPTKDSSVDVSHIDTRLSDYLSTLPQSFQSDILITSGTDSPDVHVAGSLHNKGKALDLRYNSDLYNYIQSDPTAKQYGVSTLDPTHGNAPHIHLQIK